MMKSWDSLFSLKNLMILATLLRIGFFLFGLFQDLTMEVKYTDIDYYVFTDASRFVFNGLSPYERETYRYTPLLSWVLLPTSLNNFDNELINLLIFSFGKFLFILADLVSGYLIYQILNHLVLNNATNNNSKKLDSKSKNLILALTSVWLLNPMVITISTRGSCESVLSILVLSFIYYLLIKKMYIVSGLLLGFSIHFKIYPIIYLPTSIIYLSQLEINNQKNTLSFFFPFNLIKLSTLKLAISTILSLFSLNLLMYNLYGHQFLYHTYLYHLTRIDHRHNFSLYNIMLYFESYILSDSFKLNSNISINPNTIQNFLFSKISFLPQILLSIIIIPFCLNYFNNANIKLNLISKNYLFLNSLFLQTFTFVTYNKVITSQYFIWYIIFLPFFLLNSSLLLKKNLLKSLSILFFWVTSQTIWLYNAYNLEFLGKNVFYPNIFYSSVFFFLVNVWILDKFIKDSFLKIT
ncbi:glycosylphosphatidylinositol-alpha 1,4 mannosyltransferase I [Ascoidea rubescens DSM 1968]|uniref:GPI mannosyltransferase 1 n=1 Tax=Ascoidea rubescens DSM 1968 TaxID=1344418 RepID=A0A1D2VM52_9ASCO|nr:glycosyltransferase family 50 protein [Ascoidea rubescens DSM 1968]ODV62625.1 glycosyltransferase family 50 protein [Ascoidea rubescens DSM 1968]